MGSREDSHGGLTGRGLRWKEAWVLVEFKGTCNCPHRFNREPGLGSFVNKDIWVNLYIRGYLGSFV